MGSGDTLASGLPELSEVPKLNGARRLITLHLRHNGDAVVEAMFIRQIKQASPQLEVDAVGRPEFEPILRLLSPIHRYVPIDVPMLRSHELRIAGLLRSAPVLWQLRRVRYDAAINLVGDVRANLIGRLTGARLNVAPIWAKKHAFRRFVHQARKGWPLDVAIPIPITEVNVYDIANFMARVLSGSFVTKMAVNARVAPDGSRRARHVVGIHPGASRPWREWPLERWAPIVRELVASGLRVKVFVAPSEKGRVTSALRLDERVPGVSLSAGSVEGFLSELPTVDLLLGMDSFSVHAAFAQQVPTIMLNGANDPEIFAPPGAVVLGAGERCRFYPCYNRPKCQGRAGEYICIKGIADSDILRAVRHTLGRGHATTGACARPIPEPE